MKIFYLMAILIVMFSCKNNESKGCQKPQILNLKSKVSKIEIINSNSERFSIHTSEKIDSIFSKMDSSCLKFIKFASSKSLVFYDKDSILFEAFFRDNFFKIKGKVYQIDIGHK